MSVTPSPLKKSMLSGIVSVMTRNDQKSSDQNQRPILPSHHQSILMSLTTILSQDPTILNRMGDRGRRILQEPPHLEGISKLVHPIFKGLVAMVPMEEARSREEDMAGKLQAMEALQVQISTPLSI